MGPALIEMVQKKNSHTLILLDFLGASCSPAILTSTKYIVIKFYHKNILFSIDINKY